MLTKLEDLNQGVFGITYKVTGTGDFAKTNTKSGGSLANEIQVTKLVRLAVHGHDNMSG